MSEDFTYDLPDERKYMAGLLMYLKNSDEDYLLELVNGAKCSISATSSFSRKRWNAMWTKIVFHIPMMKFKQIEAPEKQRLLQICDVVMPKNAGYDIMQVDFSPDLDDEQIQNTLEEDIQNIQQKLEETGSTFDLPRDVLQKGAEMAEVYLYLYAVENFIRLFIQKVSIEKFGEDFFQKLSTPSSIDKGIRSRKEQEIKNKWLRVRGDSELFYLDFKELGQLILNNWEIFKKYFPSQSWLSAKIDELGDCRNLVAHNSYLEKHERDIIRINFNSLLRQLS